MSTARIRRLRPTYANVSATVRLRVATLAAGVALGAAACGGGDDGTASGDPPTDTASDTDNGSGIDSGSGIDRCGLLTDEEVEAVIGPHDGGSNALDIPALYGSANSCLWTATAPPSDGPHADGSYDSVEVSVLEAEFGDLERTAVGENPDAQPVDGFVEGARWNGIAGWRLWFDCPDDRFCHIRISTNQGLTVAGEPALDESIRLGRLVMERL